jgi:hypothetical protein
LKPLDDDATKSPISTKVSDRNGCSAKASAAACLRSTCLFLLIVEVEDVRSGL